MIADATRLRLATYSWSAAASLGLFKTRVAALLALAAVFLASAAAKRSLLGTLGRACQRSAKKIQSEAPSAKRYDRGIHKFRIWTTTWLIAIWCSSLARHTFHASLISFALLYHWEATPKSKRSFLESLWLVNVQKRNCQKKLVTSLK